MKRRERKEIGRLLKELGERGRVRLRDVMIVSESYQTVSSLSGEFCNLISAGARLVAVCPSREEAYSEIIEKAERVNASHVFIEDEKSHEVGSVYHQVSVEPYRPRTESPNL